MDIKSANSEGLAASLQVKTTGGYLYNIHGVNTNVADQYILVFDSASTPGGTDKPRLSLVAVASLGFFFDFTSLPRKFTTGIYVCNSSTPAALTAGAADCTFDVGYV